MKRFVVAMMVLLAFCAISMAATKCIDFQYPTTGTNIGSNKIVTVKILTGLITGWAAVSVISSQGKPEGETKMVLLSGDRTVQFDLNKYVPYAKVPNMTSFPPTSYTAYWVMRVDYRAGQETCADYGLIVLIATVSN
jgi:hypothetical protein